MLSIWTSQKFCHLISYVTQSVLLMTLKKKALENTVGNGENAFSPFPTVFSTLSKREIIILTTFNLSADAFNFGHIQNFDVW